MATSEFRMAHRVEFADTDMAGIAHFSSCFRYMEVTEHAFLRSLGFSVTGGEVGWPRVHVECDYAAPLRFEDEIEAHLKVREKKAKALVYDFVLRRIKPGPVVEVARGSMTAVCVARDKAGKMRAVPIPEKLARAVKAAR